MRVERPDRAVTLVLFGVVIHSRPDSLRCCRSRRTATKRPALDVLHVLLHIKTGVIRPGGDVKEPCARAVGRVIPVGSTLVSRKDQRALSAWSHSGDSYRPALFIEPAGPVYFDKRFAQEELTGRSIQHIEEAIPVGPEHDLAWAALPLHIDQDRNLRRVVIKFIVGRKLVIPFQLAGIRIERDHGTAIEIVAPALVA